MTTTRQTVPGVEYQESEIAMESRDAILNRIRTALAGGPSVDLPPVPEVWPRSNPPTEQLVERFAEELQAVQGEILRCGSVTEARQALAELIEQSEWSLVGAVDRPICRELAAELPPDAVAWTREGWPPSEMADLPVGLVAAETLLADTGTCMVASETAEQRLMCYLPPACIVVARADQLAEHLPAAWEEIARRTADPQRRGEFVFITGPSRTADIEKILILGAHGPKRLVVILVG